MWSRRVRRGGLSARTVGVLDPTFDAPTNLVEISASFRSDVPGMNLYDSLGDLIARCWAMGVQTLNAGARISLIKRFQAATATTS